jgi:hypothetical protein
MTKTDTISGGALQRNLGRISYFVGYLSRILSYADGVHSKAETRCVIS